jgi:CheY-like chemotaxis protein
MAMGYKNIALLALQVENLCRKLIDSKTSLDAAMMDSFPQPKALNDALDYIEKTNDEVNLVKETESTKQISENIHPENLHLLLVEDDLFFQKMCIDKLREKSIIVDFSDNGEDAIARLAGKKYDCILLDIIMPKKNGFDVLQYAKENNIIPQTPIIVFSTLGQEENVQKALAMGAVDFINKGNFDFNLLMTKIEAAAHKQ